MIEISVIIPTHNGRDPLVRTLKSLSRQTLACRSFEVIVVADRCTDGTVSALQHLELPYVLKVFELKGARGASAARNRGAAEAAGRILVFLDDDIEACETLLSAHLEEHNQAADAVVLGDCPMAPPVEGEDEFTTLARFWWSDLLSERARVGHRFYFKDFCAGNVSMPAVIFHRSGGFLAEMGDQGASEDWELGFRLLKQGVPFRRAARALGIHHSFPDIRSNLRRVEQDGYGQALVTLHHPVLFWQFQISRLSRLSYSVVLAPVWQLIWRRPQICSFADRVLVTAYRVAKRMGRHGRAHQLHQHRRNLAYWRGVHRALGSLNAWERLAQDAPVEPADIREIELDLASELSSVEFLVTSAPVDSIRLLLRGVPLGRIEPWVGAESLRPEYVKEYLIWQCSGPLLSIFADRFATSSDACAAQGRAGC